MTITPTGENKNFNSLGRKAAWRVADGYLQDSESNILASFAALFQIEDRGLVIISI